MKVASSVPLEEWENCPAMLRDSELSTIPAVALVLMQSQFDCLDPQSADTADKRDAKEQSLDQAYRDCKNKLLRREYSRQIAAIDERMRQHPEEQQELFPKLFDLIRKKKEL